MAISNHRNLFSRGFCLAKCGWGFICADCSPEETGVGNTALHCQQSRPNVLSKSENEVWSVCDRCSPISHNSDFNQGSAMKSFEARKQDWLISGTYFMAYVSLGLMVGSLGTFLPSRLIQSGDRFCDCCESDRSLSDSLCRANTAFSCRKHRFIC